MLIIYVIFLVLGFSSEHNIYDLPVPSDGEPSKQVRIIYTDYISCGLKCAGLFCKAWKKNLFSSLFWNKF